MKRDQDIIDPPITKGVFFQIVAPIYKDDTDTELEPGLAGGVVTWRLIGAEGDVISKTSAGAKGVTIDVPETGYITVDIEEEDTSDLINGDYEHMAELIFEGHTRGLFSGIARLVA